VLEPAECIGFDYDQKLVDFASERELNPPGVKFKQGNAMELPYADGSFDVVFTRYLLVHMADPDAVVSETLRVLKPGGYAIAFEPDSSHEFSYPDSWGLKQMTRLWNGLLLPLRWAGGW